MKPETIKRLSIYILCSIIITLIISYVLIRYYYLDAVPSFLMWLDNILCRIHQMYKFKRVDVSELCTPYPCKHCPIDRDFMEFLLRI